MKRIQQIILFALPIGGRIFYDNGSNGARYKFYDAGLNEITTQTVANLASAKYYTKSGFAIKDRWYVCDSTLKSGLQWGMSSTEFSRYDFSSDIGYGKSNTSTLLRSTGWESDSIFAYVQTMRNNKVGDCDDWFIGTEEEQNKLRESGLVDWYNKNNIWSSYTTGINYTYCWKYENQAWNTYARFNDENCFGMRSF